MLVHVRGDSMEPEIMDGDALLVDLDVEPQPGRYVVATIGDRALVKRLRLRKGRLVLQSASGAILSGEPEIVGVVREIRRTVL